MVVRHLVHHVPPIASTDLRETTTGTEIEAMKGILRHVMMTDGGSEENGRGVPEEGGIESRQREYTVGGAFR